MKYAFVFTLLIAAVCASPLGSSSAPPAVDGPLVVPITTTPIPILKQELSIENGSFVNNFETGHGIVVNESGSQKQIGTASGTVSTGSFSFTNPEGAAITVTWIANENGFQPTGDHLPTPPPTPEHVVKMLADMEAALDAISIATEKPVNVVVAAEGAPMDVSQDPVPAASAPAQVEVAAVVSAAVESVPAVGSPAETASAQDSLDDAVPAETTPVEAASSVSSTVEAVPVQNSLDDAAPAEPSADASVPAETTPVEAAPAVSSPVETVPVQDSLDDGAPVEPSADAAVPAEATPVEAVLDDDTPVASAPVESAPSAL
ncbi:putative Cuticular protein 78Cb [Daphnia magna]|uniref:Putative Cuticular protein 78Cb n=1 Tax=Daphnia magna TaxID=35525 RepID=A0A164PIS0_9CRUS|nr:putative Cuticular protein 78Cb [Daphnia magna]